MNDLFNLKFAIAAQQFRAEVTFKKVKELLDKNQIDVILLKGPHLGNTVYDSPKDRLYGDVDVLVRPRDFSIAAAALLAGGFAPLAFETFAPEVQDDFKHWEYRSPQDVTVELHRWLSGHDRFPFDEEGIFARAESFTFGETPALGLGTEDLLLHLCLHMGTSYFKVIERKHILDISLLVKKRAIDWNQFLWRAKQAGCKAIAYYCLQAARLQHGAVIPDEVFSRLRPCFIRRHWLEKYINPGAYPIYRFPDHAIEKIKRNMLFSLLDKPSQWLRFAGRMMRNKSKAIGNRRGARGEGREGRKRQRQGAKGKSKKVKGKSEE